MTITLMNIPSGPVAFLGWIVLIISIISPTVAFRKLKIKIFLLTMWTYDFWLYHLCIAQPYEYALFLEDD